MNLKRARLLLFGLCAFLCLPRNVWAQFAYIDTVTVTSNSALLPSTQSNFSVLYSVTNANLKTVGNGGQVQDAEGDDIRFFSDSGCSSAIPFEREYYNGSTGAVVFWVKIASLSLSSNFYVCFGDAALTTNASSTSTWDSNFSLVYHLADGTTLSATDSTTNGNNGTVAGPDPIAGQIDGGARIVDGFDRRISLSSLSGFVANLNTANQTYEVWIKRISGYSYSHNETLIGVFDSGPSASNEFGVRSGNFGLAKWGGTTVINVADPTSDSAWTHTAWTWDGTTNRLYVNGAEVTTSTVGLLSGTPDHLYISTWNSSGDVFPGDIDEVRISKTLRSADWIKTEYSNQSDPATFLSHNFSTFAGSSLTAFVASCTLRSDDGSSKTSASCDMTGANLLVACVSRLWSVSYTFSDSETNTWTGLTTRNSTFNGARQVYAENATVNSMHTFTVTCTLCYPSAVILGFANTKASAPFDQENGNTATSVTTVATNSITPTENDEVAVACLSYGVASSPAINGGFSTPVKSDHRDTMNYGSAASYLIQATLAAANPTFSSITSSDVGAAIASFKNTAPSMSGGGGSCRGAFSLFGVGGC